VILITLYIPILQSHALYTSTNTDIDHTNPNGIGNVDAGLEATTALSVQGLHSCAGGEAGSQSSSSEFSRTTAWGEDITDSNVLNEARVDSGTLDESLEGTKEHVGCHGILEATFSGPRYGGSEGACYDDLFGG
jgi:hypothetical protein